MEDRIAKQKLDIILLVDCSTSMRGGRINQVNEAIRDMQKQLVEMQKENTNVDFYLTIITFSTDARIWNQEKSKNVTAYSFRDIPAGGWTNLHLAFQKLEELLKKESKGGMMPDFGGVAPILLLMTDGHPTGNTYEKELNELRKLPWFQVSLRYGIAISLRDKRTYQVLDDFVGQNGEVIDCYSSKRLKEMIKLIVLTASKVKSSSTSLNLPSSKTPYEDKNSIVRQEIHQALEEVDDLEW